MAHLGLVVVAISMITGCSNRDSGVDEKRVAAEWAAEISRAKGAATSDFEKAVFDDDKITPEEYDEAIQRYVACMKEALPAEFSGGFEAVKDEFGVYGYNGPQTTEEGSAAFDAAFTEADKRCGAGTKVLIEPLYSDMIVNPKRLSAEEQTLDCLKRHKVVDDSYTMENYRADFAVADSEGSNPKDSDPGKATGLDINSDGAQKCSITPWY